MKATGEKDGKGVLKYSDLSVFYGHFRNDKVEGTGRLILSQGDVYEGEWKPVPDEEIINLIAIFCPLKATFHGKGTKIEFNKGHYTGDWENGQKHGYGNEFFSDGSEYNGFYESDLFNGGGIYKKIDGEIYNGNFLNGERSGDGK